MRVIFLDIDGVLNSAQSAELYYGFNQQYKSDFVTFKENLAKDATSGEFCPIAVSNLNYLLQNLPDVKIVVSSFWRWGNDVAGLQEIFKWLGLPAERIISTTPIIHSVARGVEILKWLELNPGVTQYAVIDDDSDMPGIPAENFFLTDPYLGLDYRRAISVVLHFEPNKWKREDESTIQFSLPHEERKETIKKFHIIPKMKECFKLDGDVITVMADGVVSMNGSRLNMKKGDTINVVTREVKHEA